MSDDNEIIDVEAVEVEDSENLPAVVVERASSSEPIELPNRQDALLADNPGRRCVATNSRGERCRKFAIYGATVCRTHGGATKRFKEAARIRVENASNRLIGKLIEFAFDDTKPPDVQLKAIQNSLDRAGLKPPAEVVLSQGETKPYETVFEGISVDPRAAGFDFGAMEDGISAGGQPSPAPAYDTSTHGQQAEAGGGINGHGGSAANDADRSSRHDPPHRPTATATTATASLRPATGHPRRARQRREKCTSRAWRQSGWRTRRTGTAACGSHRRPSDRRIRVTGGPEMAHFRRSNIVATFVSVG
ncbi:hypothetical protein ACAG24_025185 [Mycobacterium sp. pW049]|uniref:hypothetical protein n=1 Tax=[Mycobacterium] bulgaricum TaxID=3238985 RepID=UPI00351BA176